MTNESVLTYKGFTGSIDVSIEDKCLHGVIEFINDLVTYEAETVGEIEQAFRDAVDDYLETCKELGKDPERPYKGTFNVRVGPDLHKRAAMAAKRKGISLNEIVSRSLESYLEQGEGISSADLLTLRHSLLASRSIWRSVTRDMSRWASHLHEPQGSESWKAKEEMSEEQWQAEFQKL